MNAFLFHDTSLNSRFFMGAIFVLGSSIAYASIMHPNLDTHYHHPLHHSNNHHASGNSLEEGNTNKHEASSNHHKEEDLDEEDVCYNYCQDYLQSHNYCLCLTRWMGDKNNK